MSPRTVGEGQMKTCSKCGNEFVSEALGHASVRMTLDRYSHAIPHLQTEAAQLLDIRLRALLGEDTDSQEPSTTS